jgi:hypothetical protein
MRRAALYALCMLLAGCAAQGAAVPGRLAGPSPLVMVPPKQLPLPQANEDAKELLAQCRAEYGRETGKLPPLQSYVRRITKPAS